MKHRSEHQRNIAFDLLRMQEAGVNISDYFEENEPVAIYGLDFLSRQLLAQIEDKVNIVCFIDRSHDRENFHGIPVFSLENSKLQSVLAEYAGIKVVVMIMHDWMNIRQDILQYCKNAIPVSIYQITSWIKLYKMNIFAEKQGLTTGILKKMISDEETAIDKVVLVGTGYTQLLSMLILSGWEKTLFIAERFLPKQIAEKMAEHGIPCLYEEEAGEFYDMCYLVAEYIRKRKIPVYGHDHMLLSQAFLENPIQVIEDGDINYFDYRAKKVVRILDDNRIYYPFGYDQSIEAVFLTGLMEIPQEINGKTVLINPTELWENKTNEEKEILSRLFSFPYEEIKNMVDSGKDILLLTEPYTKMKGQHSISVEKQIALTSDVLSLYDRNKVIIKPHPSDEVDYGKYFSGCSVIEKNFPIQMLKWAGIKFDKIVMFGRHTCMYALMDAYKIDVHEEIPEKYGIEFK